MQEKWSDDLARAPDYQLTCQIGVGIYTKNWTNFNHKGPPRQLKDSKERYDELVQYDMYIIKTAEFVPKQQA